MAQRISKSYPTYRTLGRPIYFFGLTGLQVMILFLGTIGLCLVFSWWFIVTPFLLYVLVLSRNAKEVKKGNHRYFVGILIKIFSPVKAVDRDGFLKDL